MLGLPKVTEFNKRIPKQKFYENISVTLALRRVFVEQINTIYWKNKIAPTTLNLEAGTNVEEIEVFEIKLNNIPLDVSVLKQIDSEIPYHIIFILEHNGLCQAWTAYKEKTSNGSKAFKVDKYYHTGWLPEDELELKLDGLNMDSIYESYVRQIAGDALVNKANETETLKESVERDKQIQFLNKQIETLQLKIRREKQFNRQIELNAELKRIKKRIGVVVMKNMSISERLTYSTVLIHCEYKNGTFGAGTGFIIDFCENNEKRIAVPVLITNNHVVEDSVKTVFEFCKADHKVNPIDTESIPFTYSGKDWVRHPDADVDLRCLPLGNTLNELSRKGINVFYIPLNTDLIPTEDQLKDFSAMEDVVMIGYPIGLSDKYNHKPIIRRGITSSHPNNNYQGKRETLIDIACYPGSSGSPIFILNQGAYTVANGIAMGNRLHLLGVLQGGHEFNAKGEVRFSALPGRPTAITSIPINLGIMIKSERILEFENYFKKLLGGSINGQDENGNG